MIKEVNEDCEIIFDDGTIKVCPFRPHYRFAECKPGYGDNGFCEKWKYHNKKGASP